MNASTHALVGDALLASLPDSWRARVREVVLERTPHGGQRWRLTNARGQVLAVAARSEATREGLEAADLPAGILVPSQLAQCEIAGLRYSVREYLPGHALDVERRRDPARSGVILHEACELLAALQEGATQSLHFDAGMWARWIDAPAQLVRATPLAEPAQRAALAALLAELAPLRDRKIVFGRHHGDFQFSNLIRTDSGAIAIIDWELSQGRAPILMDLIHLLIAGEVEHGSSYEAAAARLAQDLSRSDSSASLCLRRHCERFAVSEAERAWHAALGVLHGLSHFVRRVPHLADGPRIAGFLRSGELLLRTMAR